MNSTLQPGTSDLYKLVQPAGTEEQARLVVPIDADTEECTNSLSMHRVFSQEIGR